jgi:predicted nucleic acid-binding Zn ribbon protein
MPQKDIDQRKLAEKLQTGNPKDTYVHRDRHPDVEGYYYAGWDPRRKGRERWHTIDFFKPLKGHKNDFLQTGQPKGVYKKGEKHPSESGYVFYCFNEKNCIGNLARNPEVWVAAKRFCELRLYNRARQKESRRKRPHIPYKRKEFKEKECACCGNKFLPKANSDKYCSKECRELSTKAINQKKHREKNPISPRDCPNCGKTFEPRKLSMKFCSRSCTQTHNADKQKAKRRGCSIKKANTPLQKKCPACGKHFETNFSHKKACSDKCNNAIQDRKSREKNAEKRKKRREQQLKDGIIFENCLCCGKKLTKNKKKYCSTLCRHRHQDKNMTDEQRKLKNARSDSWRQRNPEKQKQSTHNYMNNKGGKEKASEYGKEQRKKHPEKSKKQWENWYAKPESKQMVSENGRKKIEENRIIRTENLNEFYQANEVPDNMRKGLSISRDGEEFGCEKDFQKALEWVIARDFGITVEHEKFLDKRSRCDTFLPCINLIIETKMDAWLWRFRMEEVSDQVSRYKQFHLTTIVSLDGKPPSWGEDAPCDWLAPHQLFTLIKNKIGE